MKSFLVQTIAVLAISASAMQIVLPPECGEKAHRIAAKELARYWKEICGEELEVVAAGDKSALPTLFPDRYRLRSLHRPLAEMRPTLPRTAESWKRVMRDLSASATFFTTH